MPERTREHHVTDRTMNNQQRNTTEVTLSADEVRELIARRAYDLYQRRGTELGDELGDWLRAEAEVVTMLLAGPQETGPRKPNGQLVARTIKASRVMRAGNRSQPLESRLQKRKNVIKSNPA